MVNICEVLDKAIERFSGNDGRYDYYDNHGEDIEGTLSETLGTLVDSGYVSSFCVNDETVFESCGCDYGVVSVSWVDRNGDLDNVVYIWEKT